MAPEIFEHCQRIAKHVRPLRQRAVLDRRSPRSSGTTTAARWIIRTDRGDAIRARFVAMGTGPLHRPEAARHPRHRDASPATPSTRAAGTTTYTGGDPNGAPMTKLADKRVGIIGTGATAVQCIPPPRARRAGAVRVPTHAVVDRRPQQPSDRPRVVRDARARLAAEVAAELRDAPDRRLRRRGPRARTAGPTSPSASATGSSQKVDGRRRVRRPSSPSARSTRATTRRWRRSVPRCRRASSQTRETAAGAQALVPPAVQAAVLPRRVPAGLQRAERATSSTPTARASSASTRPACGSAGVHYELDCLIFASGFEVGTELRPPLGLRHDRARRLTGSPSTGRTACTRCTASTCTASRTSSSSASRRAPT